MNKRTFLIVARLLFGTLSLVAVTVQAVSLMHDGVFNTVNYFSYFTNISNIFVSVVFIISALYLIKHRQPSATDDLIRGASVLYMAVVGATYATLLAAYEVPGVVPWANVVVHYIMPAVVILDWLYQPQRTKLALRQIAVWLIFPALFLAYSLIRGSIVGWYPYPFLDPGQVGGYSGVAVYCTGILVAFFAFGWLLMTLGNILKRNVAR